MDDDYEEISHYVLEYKKFNMAQHVTKFLINTLGDYPEERMEEILQQIIDRAFEITEGKPQMFGIILESETLQNPIVIPSRSKEQNSVELILNEIDKLE